MYLNIGIDVAKDVHEACILNDKGEQIGKYIRIKNFGSSLLCVDFIIKTKAVLS